VETTGLADPAPVAQTSGEVDVERLNDWLGELLAAKGVDIFRSKGILAGVPA
jgi:G3E family GTPase